jgi:hypothetical protein
MWSLKKAYNFGRYINSGDRPQCPPARHGIDLQHVPLTAWARQKVNACNLSTDRCRRFQGDLFLVGTDANSFAAPPLGDIGSPSRPGIPPHRRNDSSANNKQP